MIIIIIIIIISFYQGLEQISLECVFTVYSFCRQRALMTFFKGDYGLPNMRIHLFKLTRHSCKHRTNQRMAESKEKKEKNTLYASIIFFVLNTVQEMHLHLML